jgi:hypothetical protein
MKSNHCKVCLGAIALVGFAGMSLMLMELAIALNSAFQ